MFDFRILVPIRVLIKWLLFTALCVPDIPWDVLKLNLFADKYYAEGNRDSIFVRAEMAQIRETIKIELVSAIITLLPR
jgi:hypothetical protein